MASDVATRYLIERMLSDVQFLVDQGHLKSYQATSIRSQLCPLLDEAEAPAPAPAARAAPISSAVSPPPVASTPARPPSSASTPTFRAPAPAGYVPSPLPSSGTPSSSNPAFAAARKKVPPPPPGVSMPSPAPTPEPPQPVGMGLARAMWDYDASGGSDELAFRTGDTITVLEHVNPDWWRGFVKGAPHTEGIFPSNYVEMIEAEPAAGRQLPPAYAPPAQGAGYLNNDDKSPHPVMSKWSSSGAVPSEAPQPGAPVPMDPTEQEKRKNQFKKVGGRVGNAAAGGFGFGIGAGLASNLF